MSSSRLLDYINRMVAAAKQAHALTDAVSLEDFLADVKTQLAVGMSLVLLGEAAARIGTNHPDFVAEHPEIPWSKIKGMRNLIVQDYARTELPAIWNTSQTDLPTLVAQLEVIRNWRAEGE